MKIVFRLSSLLIVSLFALSIAFAQNTKPSPTPTPQSGDDNQRVFIREVRVPVIIMDKKTKLPVTGLTKTDFQIFEDGQLQKIESFSDEKANEPIFVAVLMDTSPSTAGKKKFSQEAAINFIHTVTRLRKDKVAFMTFDDRITLHQDFTDKLDLLSVAVDKAKRVGNQTALYDAVYEICDEKLRNVPGKRVIVLITDGDDTYSRANLDDVIDIARRTDTTIFALSTKGGFAGSTVPGVQAGIVKDAEDKVLDKICDVTGGAAFYTGDMLALEKAFTRISKQLRSQYIIRYVPINNNYDDTERKIDVKLVTSEKSLEIQFKKGYKAKREPQ